MQLSFGRSLALLLIALFVLTGAQMGLSLLKGDAKGVVLGEANNSSDREKEKNKHQYVWPTVVIPPTVEVTIAPTVTTTPTEEATPTLTPTATETPEPVVATPTTEPTQTAPTQVTTTTNTLQQAGETVRNILQQIGLPVRVTPTPAPEPEKITVQEEVVNERSAGEILRELEATVGTGVQAQTRLRFVASDGSVGLRAEVRSGEGVALSTEDSAKVKETLRLGSGLVVGKSGEGQLVFSRGTARATTALPLLVDLEKNTLMVETTLGMKTVAILPDTAISKAVAAGAFIAVNPETISLIERDDGKIAYRMTGQITRRLIGLFAIKANTAAEISAESGRVLPSLTSSLGGALTDLVAPQAR